MHANEIYCVVLFYLDKNCQTPESPANCGRGKGGKFPTGKAR